MRYINIYTYIYEGIHASQTKGVVFSKVDTLPHTEKPVAEYCQIEPDLKFNYTFPIDLASNQAVKERHDRAGPVHRFKRFTSPKMVIKMFFNFSNFFKGFGAV